MSLDVYLTAVRPTNVFEANITNNLVAMALEAGLYKNVNTVLGHYPLDQSPIDGMVY